MKLKKNALSDNTLRIISLVISIGLWFYVAQIHSPNVERTVKNVPVVFAQKDVLEKKNLVLLDDNEQTIDIKIRGQRKYVYSLNTSNINVMADVGNLDTTGKHSVITNIVLPFANLEIINKNPSLLSVTVDDLMVKEFPVTVETVGTPKSDFVCSETFSSVDYVVAKGPKSIISAIEKIVAPVDISGKSANIATECKLEVYGSGNNIIETPYISLSNEVIDVSCEILKTKTVEIVPVFSGNVDAPSSYSPDSANIKTVKIAGVSERIDDIFQIHTKPIQLGDISGDGTIDVVLNLPQGIISLDGETFVYRFWRSEDSEH